MKLIQAWFAGAEMMTGKITGNEEDLERHGSARLENTMSKVRLSHAFSDVYRLLMNFHKVS